jgi:hypothetical protein
MNPLRRIEQEVLALGREWTRLEWQKRLQEQCDAMPMECAPTGQPLKNTRGRQMELDTVSGKVALRARHGRQAPHKKWVCPARVAWGLSPSERKTPELQARLAYTATGVGSYAEAETMAATWGTPVSDGGIHQPVQSLGSRAQALGWPTPLAGKSEPPFSRVIMRDGWMARERGADWGAGPRKKNPQRVEWREIQSAVIYRREQRVENASGRGLLLEKYTVATPPETSPVEFGSPVHREALRRGLARAQGVYLVLDGAVWLWDLAEDRFQEAVQTLDFHHAREHRHAVAESLHSPGTPQSKEWLRGMLHRLRHGKETPVVPGLAQRLESPGQPSAEPQEIITREVNYFQEHEDHLHYSALEKAGAPRGSGAVESLGKQLQRRLRGWGQFWGRPGLTRLLHLSALVKNHDHHHLWN